jgi:hypothetical protein
MKKRITEKQAEQVRAIIIKKFGNIATEPPKVIMDWDYGPAIVWEEGPYDWSSMFVEMAAGYKVRDTEFGFTRTPVKIPAGIFIEPATSYAISMYPEA